MKKYSRNFVLLITTCFYLNFNYAQDLLIRMDSIVMKTKILEINDQSVKYKDFDNLDGPIYTLDQSKIYKIIYQNGKEDYFQPLNSAPIQINSKNVPEILSFEQLMNMNDNEKENYLSKIGINSIYDKFKSGNDMSQKGKNLRGSGVGLTIGGTIFYTIGLISLESGSGGGAILGLLGVAALTTGQVLIIVSIPLSAVGGAKKLSAENMYKDYTQGNRFSSMQPQLNFGLTHNGIGLSLKF